MIGVQSVMPDNLAGLLFGKYRRAAGGDRTEAEHVRNR